MFLTFLKVLHV